MVKNQGQVTQDGLTNSTQQPAQRATKRALELQVSFQINPEHVIVHNLN